MLEERADLEVVAEAEDGLAAIRSVQKHHPALLMLDLSMPKLGGIAAIKEVKSQFPETSVDPFADLPPHLAKSGPPHVQLGKGPLEEVYAI